MDFAVTVRGKTQWVLAVEGDKVLLCLNDTKLEWVPMSECKFAMVAGPEQARPVVVMQPQKRPKLARASAPITRLIRGNHG